MSVNPHGHDIQDYVSEDARGKLASNGDEFSAGSTARLINEASCMDVAVATGFENEDIDALPPADDVQKDLPDKVSLSGPEYDVVPSLVPRALMKGKKLSSFNMMLNLFGSMGATVFKDQHGRVWAFTRENGIYRTVPLDSAQFYSRCLKLYHDSTGEAVSEETVARVSAYLANTETIFNLHNRFAHINGKIYIDLANDAWEAVEICRDGYMVISPDRPLFRRFGHQKAIPVPDSSGTVEEILQFLPIRDEETKLLALVWLCSTPLASIPRPVLIIHGQQGAGKSSTAEFMRGVVDPSSTPTLSLSSSDNEFIQLVDHHAVVNLDNLHALPQRVSDSICRAVTGGGHAKRTLFTNDDDFYYYFLRTFVMNGINIAATSPDLLDRSILIELERIPEDERTAKTTLDEAYEGARARIFGGICNTLVKALNIKECQTHVPKLPRMADWCLYGMCIAQALGIDQGVFYHAYVRNMRSVDQEVVDTEPICQALISLMLARGDQTWEGTPAHLYRELTAHADRRGHKDAAWPKAANTFARRLRSLRHNMEAFGYIVRERKSRGTKLISLEKV